MDGNNDSNNDFSISISRMFLHSDQWRQCGRRVPRAEVEPGLHKVWIGLPELSKTFFSVRTIGELGAFCAIDGGEELPVEPDHVVDVVLSIENDRYTFEGRIRYMAETGMAIEFVHPPEEVRNRLRTLFEPELLATTLVPFLSYTTMEPGSTATLIYSDGEFNRLQIALVSEKILAVFLDLAVLDTRLVWRKAEARKTGDMTLETMHPDSQKKIMNFVRNLQGLPAEFLKDIESILTQGRLC